MKTCRSNVDDWVPTAPRNRNATSYPAVVYGTLNGIGGKRRRAFGLKTGGSGRPCCRTFGRPPLSAVGVRRPLCRASGASTVVHGCVRASANRSSARLATFWLHSGPKRAFPGRLASARKTPQTFAASRLQKSGGHGTRTRNPLRGTTFPMWPLAIRLPSQIGHKNIPTLRRSGQSNVQKFCDRATPRTMEPV